MMPGLAGRYGEHPIALLARHFALPPARSLAAAATALVVALGLAACGTRTVDSGDLETQLQDRLAAQVGVDPAEVSVSCPDEIVAEQGREYECTLTTPDGDEARVEVRMIDDEGRFRARVPPGQFEDGGE